MKNIINNPIFTFVIGIVIASSSVVIASNLLSSQVSYTPKDNTWGVNNVEAAIDSLKVSNTSDNYSTDEKVVGTWIDGKPLYQKIIYVSNATVSSWSRYSIDTTSLLDNEHIIVQNMLGGYYVDFGATYQQYHTWGDSGYVDANTRYGYNAHYRQAEKLIAIDGTWGGITYTLSNLTFTFQYTKTTD